MIKKLRVKNYKSLRDVELELGKFNVLIGPNASGKSNVLDCLAFLSETIRRDRGEFGDIRDAFSPRGGFGHVVFQGKEREKTEISIEFSLNEELSNYFLSTNKDEKVEEERLNIGDKVVIEHDRNRNIKRALSAEGTLIERSVSYTETLAHDVYRSAYEEKYPLVHRFGYYLSSWKLYQFITSEMRGKLPAKGSLELERSGGNLAQVLLSLHNEYPKIFFRVEEMLRQAIPEVEELLTPLPLGKNETFLALREEAFEEKLDYYQLSDGTLKLLAYITAIALPEPKLICFEEPENFVHARLQRLLVEILKNSEKQIILSTHSISLVNLVEPEDVIIIKKEEGETKASKVENPKELKKRLEELELGLGEYYYSGALGGVP